MAIGSLQYPLMARSEPAEQQPPVPPPTAAPASQAPAAPRPPQTAPAPKPFPIMEYQVEGNTLLPAIDIEKAVTPYLGENKTITDVEAARTQLERVYHDHGYKTVLVNIPPQKVSDGVVRLVVTQAAVGKLKITGSRYHSLQVIRSKMTQLNPDTVPNFNEVQQELGEVNRSADLRVTPILKASDTPGRVDVDLSVKDDLPLHALLQVDNRYSANTTHTRVTGELHYDNLFQSDQSLSFQYQVAPERVDDAKIWSLSYVIPLQSHFVWALYAVHSDSNVAAIGDLDVLGKGDIYGVRFIAPLPTNDRDFYHSFTAGLDYKDFKQSVFVQGATSTIESPASYPPFTLQYSATWLGAPAQQGERLAATGNARSSTNLSLGVSFLIQGLGTDWRQFANKRAGADTTYIIFRPTLSREEILPGKWSLVGSVDGQLTNGPLINNEQYSAGGADSVRGYVEAERLGDNGGRASLELRTPQLLAEHFAHHVEESYSFLFCDSAEVRVIEPLPDQKPSFTLASAGVGFRFKAAGFSVSAAGARILRDGSVTFSGRYRGVFSASYEY